jgi:hypothetical protein
MHSLPYTFSRRLFGPAVVLALSLTAAGCGNKGSISGKVTYDGSPLHYGTVSFVTDSGQVFRSEISDDGSYSIKDVPAGNVKIAVVEPMPPNPAQGGRGGGGGPPGRANMGPPPGVTLPPNAPTNTFDFAGRKDKYIKIPDNLADPDRSGKTYTVKGGPQEYNIELK